jgi:hypothetical protein
MASTTGPDLTDAREAVEALQDDACLITRPSPATFNQVTGNMDSAAPAVVYSAASIGDGGRSLADQDGTGGRCSISYPSSARAGYREEGGRQVLDSVPEARLPLDAPLVKEGDTFTVVSSRRDPQLVNQSFRVSDVIEKTMAVSRRLVLEKK